MKEIICFLLGHKYELKLNRPDVKISICKRCNLQKCVEVDQ